MEKDGDPCSYAKRVMEGTATSSSVPLLKSALTVINTVAELLESLHWGNWAAAVALTELGTVEGIDERLGRDERSNGCLKGENNALSHIKSNAFQGPCDHRAGSVASICP
jgi:hypothetical protein